MRMSEKGSCSRFANKAHASSYVLVAPATNQLDRNRPVISGVGGPDYYSHASPSKFVNQSVGPNVHQTPQKDRISKSCFESGIRNRELDKDTATTVKSKLVFARGPGQVA